MTPALERPGEISTSLIYSQFKYADSKNDAHGSTQVKIVSISTDLDWMQVAVTLERV